MSEPEARGPFVLAQVIRPAEARKRIGDAAALWLSLVLGAVAMLAAAVIWHLVRRGRLIRDRLGPPRDVVLPDLPPRPGAASPPKPEEPEAP
jgi:hypothetical protein